MGYLPFIAIGDNLKLIGKYVTHPDYGRQFKIETFEKLMPETAASLERYLSNGMIKGIGPAIAKRITKMFGEETLHVLKFEPSRLAEVRGISKDKAIEISDQFNENWELWQIVGFLEKFGIGVQNAQNVYKTLGVNAIEEIEANPYILIDVANNVDFKLIDKMAMNLGFEYNNEKRIKSGIKYAISKATANGHCAVLEDELYRFIKVLLGVENDEIEDSVIELKAKGEIVIEEREDNNWIYLDSYYKAEESVANKLITLDKARNMKHINDFEDELEKIEQKTDLILSDKQKEAIEAVNDNNVCIITGGPGTGKTTIIKVILELYKSKKRKTVLCAPTGRAAKRMTETTGEEAKTLHRLLEIGKIEEERTSKYNDFDVAPLDADVIIVDEMSMVDLFLMNYLVKAIYQGSKLVLVGDVDQLPSVGPGNVLRDLINSKFINVVRLKEIFRQGKESMIIVNAHKINNGEMPYLNKKGGDFFFDARDEVENILSTILDLVNRRLPSFNTKWSKIWDIQVLSPTRKGILGVDNLNNEIQAILNPSCKDKKEKQVRDIVFREGDKVMQIKNNYSLEWHRIGGDGENKGVGVFNGDMGYIETIDEERKVLSVVFDDERRVVYEFMFLDELELAYAITIHKSQGSEFKVVVMPTFMGSAFLMNRNILYTGITRAKELVVVVGNQKSLQYMVNNTNNMERYSSLKERIMDITIDKNMIE